MKVAPLPEFPNIITFITQIFHDVPWIHYLHQWENIFFSMLVAVSLSFLFTFGTRKKELIPSGLQNFLETVVGLLRSLIIEVLGPEGDKYLPFLGTLFIYILSMNLLGIVPLMKSPSSNLNITIALSLCVFALVQYLNIKNMGFFGFMYHLAGSPKGFMGWALVPLMFPLELITQFSRPLTLSLRLFGNILGDDIFIGMFVLFGVSMLAQWGSPIGFPLQVPFMFLAIFTGTMQALVFTLLSTVYILLSMPGSDEEHGF